MKLVFHKVSGSQKTRPLEIDTESSKTKVYLRRNIEEVSVAEDASGTNVHFWEYEEAELSPEEFERYTEEIESAAHKELLEALQKSVDAYDQATADLLLTQAEIQEAQEAQDEVLADILLNTTAQEA